MPMLFSESTMASEEKTVEKTGTGAGSTEEIVEDKHEELNKALATPAVRRLAMENKV